LADTSEAEKSADQIITLLAMPDADNELRMQFLKNRDGETPPPFVVECDYRTSYIGSRRGLQAPSAGSSASSGMPGTIDLAMLGIT
jgi:hypothetical protein